MNNHNSQAAQARQTKRINMLVHEMGTGSSPLKGTFRGIRVARRVISLFSWLFDSKHSTTNNVARMIVDSVLHERDGSGPSALEVLVAETTLEIVNSITDGGDSSPDRDTCTAVFAETSLGDKPNEINLQIRAGVVGSLQVNNPVFKRAYDKMTHTERLRLAAAIGVEVLELAHERTSEDGEKELYFEADEVYAHYGLAIERARRALLANH